TSTGGGLIPPASVALRSTLVSISELRKSCAAGSLSVIAARSVDSVTIILRVKAQKPPDPGRFVIIVCAHGSIYRVGLVVTVHALNRPAKLLHAKSPKRV